MYGQIIYFIIIILKVL